MEGFFSGIFSKKNEKRKCIFCGKSPVTREHIYPKWSFELFNIPEGTFKPSTRAIFSVLNNVGGREIEHNSTVDNSHETFYQDFVVKVVCAECNGGWMSELESNVKTIFTKLIGGLAFSSLSVPETYDLSLWCIIKTIFIAKTVPFAQEFESWLLNLLANRIIPEGFIVEAVILPQPGINFLVSPIEGMQPHNITNEEMHMAEDNSALGGIHFGPFGFRVSYLRTAVSVLRVQVLEKTILLYPHQGVMPFMDGISQIDRPTLSPGDEIGIFCSRLKLLDHYDPTPGVFSYTEFIAEGQYP